MKKIFLFVAFASFMFWGTHVRAAGIFMESDSRLQGEKKFYEVKVFLATGSNSINALEGNMFFPAENLNLEKTMNGGSIMNFWIKDPQKMNEGKIVFSGGMPGGYAGERGFVFSAIFSKKGSAAGGQIEIYFQNLKAYLNDGKGTMEELAAVSFPLNLEEGAAPQMIVEDTKPPEVFAPYVTRDPNLRGGAWVVILEAKDKGEGIDHYEVFESKRYRKIEEVTADKSTAWRRAEDPLAYILEDQKLESYIYAKAVDKSGNARVTFIFAAKNQKTAGYFNYKAISVIIILIITAVVVFLEIYYFRKKRD